MLMPSEPPVMAKFWIKMPLPRTLKAGLPALPLIVARVPTPAPAPSMVMRCFSFLTRMFALQVPVTWMVSPAAADSMAAWRDVLLQLTGIVAARTGDEKNNSERNTMKLNPGSILA